MRRVLVALIFSLFALLAPGVYAEGLSGTEDWTGGNGWCESGVCFRAWPQANGIEVRWRLQWDPAPGLQVTRLQLQPMLEPTPIVIATSTVGAEAGVREFVYLDSEVQRGAIYRYELLRSDSSQRLGDPLEAGLAVHSTDPGGGSLSYRIYLPLTLRQQE